MKIVWELGGFPILGAGVDLMLEMGVTVDVEKMGRCRSYALILLILCCQQVCLRLLIGLYLFERHWTIGVLCANDLGNLD